MVNCRFAISILNLYGESTIYLIIQSHKVNYFQLTQVHVDMQLIMRERERERGFNKISGVEKIFVYTKQMRSIANEEKN